MYTWWSVVSSVLSLYVAICYSTSCNCKYHCFAMISNDSNVEPDHHKLLRVDASAPQQFTRADKETMLSSKIYVVDCITFSDATQLQGSRWQRGARDLQLFSVMEINITIKSVYESLRGCSGGCIHWLTQAGNRFLVQEGLVADVNLCREAWISKTDLSFVLAERYEERTISLCAAVRLSWELKEFRSSLILDLTHEILTFVSL